MSENVISLTEFKSNSAELIAELKQHHQTLVLTQNGRATAVVQDFETYQRHLDAIVMLKLAAMGEADIKKGKLISQDRVFSEIRKQIKDNQSG